MDNIVKTDILEFVSSFELSEELVNSRILITGATGLIGSALIHCLIALDKGINVVAVVRDVGKAKSLFMPEEMRNIELLEADITTYDYSNMRNIDYIIHCAAPTTSQFFLTDPVDTFNTIYLGAYKLLEYARKHSVKSFVNLSSLEVYGTVSLDVETKISEDMQGYISPQSVRSCYPMAKRAVENLCCLYAYQYNLHVISVRLTQTTGAGASQLDNRVIALFARLAARGEDIILHTTGESSRPYCYITDAVEAILYALLKGSSGEIYNIANDETFISVRDLAYYIKNNFAHQINVRVEIPVVDMGYAPSSRLDLDTNKIKNVGWTPRVGLYDMLNRLICYYKNL